MIIFTLPQTQRRRISPTKACGSAGEVWSKKCERLGCKSWAMAGGGSFKRCSVLGIYGFEYYPCQDWRDQKLNIFRRIGNRGQMLYSNNFNLRQISENIQKNPCCQQGRVKIERAPLQWREFEEEFQRTPTLRWRGEREEHAAWTSN